jgi:farnesyl-diphosphate farnesyltransferase
MERFQPLYDSYLRQAEDHLSAGWQYTIALPFRFVRVRLACAWPLLIGISTLRELRFANVLDETRRIKISHSEIRRLILRSVLSYATPSVWDRLFDTVLRSPHH